ncbi:MAG: DNA-3-methyladenine glycosylase [Patescibacteria group bacterium]|nr:DNA-3-methyladenine glycosylase [Patescibacteria group bacterium]MDE2438331.1 DNA-3-methyladenine glycosylase [Patescibacteria group bacterium]
MHQPLPQSFFERPTLHVAHDMLGARIIVRANGIRKTLVITEVEAYDGPKDKASHAYRGTTPRNALMFGDAGHWYIYLVYGMHWMLNITTGPERYPAAILIRSGITDAQQYLKGPGTLSRYLGIEGRWNGLLAAPRNNLWIETTDINIPPRAIIKKPRIGVPYAKEWALKPYNFSVTPSLLSQYVVPDSISSSRRVL